MVAQSKWPFLSTSTFHTYPSMCMNSWFLCRLTWMPLKMARLRPSQGFSPLSPLLFTLPLSQFFFFLLHFRTKKPYIYWKEPYNCNQNTPPAKSQVFALCLKKACKLSLFLSFHICKMEIIVQSLKVMEV